MRVNRLLLGDDHDIVVEGLRRILDQPEFEIVGVVSDGRSLLRAAEELQPDVIIVDITMPLLNGINLPSISYHTRRCCGRLALRGTLE